MRWLEAKDFDGNRYFRALGGRAVVEPSWRGSGWLLILGGAERGVFETSDQAKRECNRLVDAARRNARKAAMAAVLSTAQ